jgi:hypothetical protein
MSPFTETQTDLGRMEKRIFSGCLRNQIRRGTARQPQFPKSRQCVSVRRKHQLRHSDFRRGRRLGKHDHLIIWTRPQRPAWMDEKTYATISEILELREFRYNIIEGANAPRQSHAAIGTV